MIRQYPCPMPPAPITPNRKVRLLGLADERRLCCLLLILISRISALAIYLPRSVPCLFLSYFFFAMQTVFGNGCLRAREKILGVGSAHPLLTGIQLGHQAIRSALRTQDPPCQVR